MISGWKDTFCGFNFCNIKESLCQMKWLISLISYCGAYMVQSIK